MIRQPLSPNLINLPRLNTKRHRQTLTTIRLRCSELIQSVAVNASQCASVAQTSPTVKRITRISRSAVGPCAAPAVTRESSDSVTMSSGPTTLTTFSCEISILRLTGYEKVSSQLLVLLATLASASTCQSTRRVKGLMSTNT